MPENQQKLSENLEDYLETISSLSAGTGAARPSDIAAAMSVKRPSVTAALNSLREKGLVEYEKYKPVTLTKDGEAVAMNVRRKHRLLSDFFTGVLGVNASEADLAACRMEHALEDSIMRKLVKFSKAAEPACAPPVQTARRPARQLAPTQCRLASSQKANARLSFQ